MNVDIGHLYEYPAHLQTVARWIHEEWWSDKPGHSVESMATRLREASGRDRIPLSLVALLEGCPVGTVNLVVNDNEQRDDLTPWLAALYVLPEHRGKGVGSKLVRSLTSEASRLGIREMYLGTDIPQYYRKLGAKMFESSSDDYCIMSIATGRSKDQVSNSAGC